MRTSLTTSTAHMYNYYVEGAGALFWDCPTPNLESFDGGLMVALATGDMEEIRKAFKEGETPLLVPDLMTSIEAVLTGIPEDTLNDLLEIRVVHNGKLIGVIIDKEINY